MVYNVLTHLHSGVRWLLLLFLILAILNTVYKNKKKWILNCEDCAFSILTMIFAHLQLVAGLVLYFISPKVIFNAASMKDSLLRFFLLEHIAIMIIAIILITFGYIKSKKSSDERRKSKAILIYYGIALILILIAIPWPFRNLGAGWF